MNGCPSTSPSFASLFKPPKMVAGDMRALLDSCSHLSLLPRRWSWFTLIVGVTVEAICVATSLHFRCWWGLSMSPLKTINLTTLAAAEQIFCLRRKMMRFVGYAKWIHISAPLIRHFVLICDMSSGSSTPVVSRAVNLPPPQYVQQSSQQQTPLRAYIQPHVVVKQKQPHVCADCNRLVSPTLCCV